MSKIDDIKPTGHNGLYKVELLVEGEWVAMALASKETIIKTADVLCESSDEDCDDSDE